MVGGSEGDPRIHGDVVTADTIGDVRADQAALGGGDSAVGHRRRAVAADGQCVEGQIHPDQAVTVGEPHRRGRAACTIAQVRQQGIPAGDGVGWQGDIIETARIGIGGV